MSAYGKLWQWSCLFIFALPLAAAFAQGYREVSKDSRIVQSDTTVQGDTLTVFQLLEVRQRLVRTLSPPPFTYDLRPGFSIVQAAFSNWVGGGVNALAWASSLHVRMQYQQGAWLWELRTVAEFGQTLVDGAFRKTNDVLDVQTFAKWEWGASFGPQFSASLRTQFADGFDFSKLGTPQISGFFDPAYSVQSLGFAYTRSDSLRASVGIAAREIFTNRFPNFADDPNTEEIERINIRAGVELFAVWLVELFSGVSLRVRTQLFAPFARLGALEVNEHLTVFLKINQFLDTRFTLVLLYQENISKRLQLQQTLELTISFKISNR